MNAVDRERIEGAVEAAAETLDRLRDFRVREIPPHVPDRWERWQRDNDEREEAERAAVEHRQVEEREVLSAYEQQAAEANANWESWLRGHLDAERKFVLDVVAGSLAHLQGEINRGVDEKVSKLEAECNALRRERDQAQEHARAQVKALEGVYTRKIETLRQEINTKQRDLLDRLAQLLQGHEQVGVLNQMNANLVEGIRILQEEIRDKR
jgi:hypothetical protein